MQDSLRNQRLNQARRQSRYYVRKLAELKEQLYAKYGKRCANCGFEDARALQIDHVYNDGHADRKKGENSRQRIRNAINDTEGRYQILCANCNWIKKHVTHMEKYNGQRLNPAPAIAGANPAGTAS